MIANETSIHKRPKSIEINNYRSPYSLHRKPYRAVYNFDSPNHNWCLQDNNYICSKISVPHFVLDKVE